MRTVRNKAFIHMQAGLGWILKQYPTRVLGLDFDNGSEFLNYGMIAYCEARKIPTITRSRPYEHNDQAHVEQRNGDWVRRHAFRYRYETEAEMDTLNRLWTQVSHRKNYLPALRQSHRLGRDDQRTQEAHLRHPHDPLRPLHRLRRAHPRPRGVAGRHPPGTQPRRHHPPDQHPAEPAHRLRTRPHQPRRLTPSHAITFREAPTTRTRST